MVSALSENEPEGRGMATEQGDECCRGRRRVLISVNTLLSAPKHDYVSIHLPNLTARVVNPDISCSDADYLVDSVATDLT